MPGAVKGGQIHEVAQDDHRRSRNRDSRALNPSVRDAVRVMAERKIGAVPVLDGERLGRDSLRTRRAHARRRHRVRSRRDNGRRRDVLRASWWPTPGRELRDVPEPDAGGTCPARHRPGPGGASPGLCRCGTSWPWTSARRTRPLALFPGNLRDVSDVRLQGLNYALIVELLVPRHLDGLELRLLDVFGSSSEPSSARMRSRRSMKRRVAVDVGKLLKQCDGDVFGVGPFHGVTSSSAIFPAGLAELNTAAFLHVIAGIIGSSQTTSPLTTAWQPRRGAP